MGTGFRCPQCGSFVNHWLPFSMLIKCDCCGNVFEPEDADEDVDED